MRVESTTLKKEDHIQNCNDREVNGRKCKQKAAINVAGMNGDGDDRIGKA